MQHLLDQMPKRLKLKGASQSFCTVFLKCLQMDLQKAGEIETARVLRGIWDKH